MSDANEAALEDREAYIRGLEKDDEIERLRAGNRDLQLWFDDLKIEYDKQRVALQEIENMSSLVFEQTRGRLFLINKTAAVALGANPRDFEPAFTEGHCEHKKAPGGCQLHNLQCGYPDCDRKVNT